MLCKSCISDNFIRKRSGRMGETRVKKLPILYGIGDGLVGKGILSLLCTSCGLKQRGLWRPGFFQPPYF